MKPEWAIHVKWSKKMHAHRGITYYAVIVTDRLEFVSLGKSVQYNCLSGDLQ